MRTSHFIVRTPLLALLACLLVVTTVSSNSGGPITGNGQIDRIPKFNGTNCIGSSVIRESTGSLGIELTPDSRARLLVGGTTAVTANTSGPIGAFIANQNGSARIADFRSSINNVRMVVESDGNVGIGTTDPNSLLEVAGTIHTTSGGIRFPDGTVQTTAAGPSVPGSTFLYYEPDSTVVVAIDNACSGSDLTGRNALTTRNLTASNLTDGKVSRKCYDFSNADMTLTLDHDCPFELSVECWLNKDAGSGFVFQTGTGHLQLFMDAVNMQVRVNNRQFNVAHDLSNDGNNQWVYVVITWSTIGNQIGVHINGVLKGELDGAAQTGVPATLIIGSDGGLSTFDGRIDGIRYLTRKMSAEEIAARYDVFR